MNVLKGIITEIQSHEGISLVKVKSHDFVFSSIVLDTPDTADYLKENKAVKVIFKETEVIISKDLNPKISVQNQIAYVVKSVKKGILLSQINLIADKLEIQSIITSNACEQLDLKENDNVIALIKTNEVSLSADD
ncbi:molybdopterin-binding protein [Flavobacterium nitrogenifigens]|uniref:Molybdopterin-binding protein n=2 Tax=Flavobacterium TaxID=237 RepID=A0A7W7N773_9FLAO|nr:MULTISPECIES: TOBE domain-containing protein [Flavobacterium]MBB4802625.1 molybdopterin-binding protein [Flavobacterium nitrogenifigens]MBB6387583.1 molybdopterin-binding protein [Flavobacterium notoginsengisoli]